MNQFSKHINIVDKGGEKRVAVDHDYPISSDVWQLLVNDILANKKYHYVVDNLYLQHLIMLLAVAGQLPRNLHFFNILASNGEPYYLGDIIHDVERGVYSDQIGPLASEYTLKQFLSNILPLKPWNMPENSPMDKPLAQYIPFVYFIYYSIHAELLEFRELFEKFDTKNSMIVSDLETLETIMGNLYGYISAQYKKRGELITSDKIDARFLLNLLNGIERGTNLVYIIEDIAINIDRYIRKSATSVLTSRLLHRLQYFDGYRQMVEKRVDESRQLKHILSKRQINVKDHFLDWSENNFKKNVRFELEIKLYQQFFDKNPLYHGERKKSGSVILFNYSDFLSA